MKILQKVLLFLLACLPASAATYSITPSTPMATIQADLAATGPNTYNFAQGTYGQITSTLTFPCATGNVYQGAASAFVPGVANNPGTVLMASFTGSNLVRVTGTATGAGCKIDGIWFMNQNVLVQAPVKGLTFTHNRISGLNGPLKGSGNTTSWAGVYVTNGTTQGIADSIFQNNTFGPSCSDVDATIGTDYGGTCGGIVVQGSNVGLVIADNNVAGQIEEFFHALGQGTGGQISENLLIFGNDMGYVHRIPIELQQQDVSNTLVQFNDVHDPYNPAEFSFLISAACCGSAGGSISPGVVISDNVLFNNVPLVTGESYNVGYGIELWGFGSIATGNLLQANHFANAIALGGFSGGPSAGMQAVNNVIQGNITAPNCEMGGTAPSCTYAGTSTVSPNIGSSTISAQVSATPTITQSGSTFTLTVGTPNTSIWYTTDGSTPVPGTATLYSAPVTLAGTIKAVGMWGMGANPPSYAAGYGYVPSPVVSATFTPVVVPPPPPPPVTPPCTSVQTGTTLVITCTSVQ